MMTDNGCEVPFFEVCMGVERWCFALALGLPFCGDRINHFFRLSRFIERSPGGIAGIGAYEIECELALTRRQYRELSRWAIREGWVKVLDDLGRDGIVLAMGDRWLSLDWPALQAAAEAKYIANTTPHSQQLIEGVAAARAAIAAAAAAEVQ